MATVLDPKPRIGIVVLAYNAESTLQRTLDRIPADVRPRIAEIIISDDASHDETFAHGRQWASRTDAPPTHVVRHTKNLGYGGNQKAAYAMAIEHGLDIVVLLHGDGQYAPECLSDLLTPLERGEADAVFGSRMMDRGAARAGGMPLYKRWGNRILTRFENAVLGAGLTEFHSGYRAYRTDLLKQVPFQANSDGFDFDTQIIVQVLHAGGRILEVPIPTYYGDEICYVNGIAYARDVVRDVIEYRLAVRGFGTSAWVPPPEAYPFKEHDGSSHAVILEMLSGLAPSRILDLGCSGGLLAEKIRVGGHVVVGVDRAEVPGVRERTDRFVVSDLERGIPDQAGTGFDVVIAGDVIEHLTRPGDALRDMGRVLRPGGQVLLSVPNFAHWYPPRARRRRCLRIRPPGYPGRDPPALLHPVDPPPAGGQRRVRHPGGEGDGTPPRADRPAGRMVGRPARRRRGVGPAASDVVRLPVRAAAGAARGGDGPLGRARASRPAGDGPGPHRGEVAGRPLKRTRRRTAPGCGTARPGCRAAWRRRRWRGGHRGRPPRPAARPGRPGWPRKRPAPA